MAKVIIPGNGMPNIDMLQLQMDQMDQWRKTLEEQRKRELEIYRVRADSIGITVEELDNLAMEAGVSIETYLCLLESLIAHTPESLSLENFAKVINKEDDHYLTAADIKKQLKHEKNPMRIKQLNKMLNGMRKNKKGK